ncbi:MAG: malectin domain-containing carbohydrate-binding protein, partial [Chloroflexota bacterium]|nr:malectin domain-containing carbohydrate-binding protein [Chloroflexota bacterium]
PEATKIAGTRDDDLYLTQRRGEGAGKRGEFSYAIPVPEDGTYQVRLHFAETYWGAPGGPEDGEGQRIFTVSAEDQPELRNYDIYDDVGAMTAVIKEFEVEVDDGELDLRFVAKRDQPAVAAIEVLAEPDGERWVDVDRASQSVQLMVGNQMIARYQASMSAGRLDDFQDTMPGSYQIQSKIAELTYTPYADNYFMYWAGFDPARENGFHSWVMDAKGRVVDGGDGPTWGCIATSPEEAAEIYAFVEIGTRIEIR